MFIWGKKAVRRDLGHVADFCPICACARPFVLTRLGVAGHVYFITVDDGVLAGHERRCTRCGVALRADPADYAAISTQPQPILALVQQTFPDFKAVYAERLQLEARIREQPGSLSAQDRQALLMAPFMLLSARVSARFETTQLDVGGAFIRRDVLPVLALALRRLRPTREELHGVLARLRQQRELIGSKVRLDDLMAAVDGPSPLPAADALLPAAVGDGPRLRQRAGLLMRVLAWLAAAALALVALSSWASPRAATLSPATFWGALLVTGGLAYGLHRAGAAVSRGQSWGRAVGLGVGLLLVAGFPIGTAVGGYLLYGLALKWRPATD